MNKVKLTKVGIAEDSKAETAKDNADWNRGVNSPPIETVVTGTPFNDLKQGCNFCLSDINIENVKDHKNFYWTSKVKSIKQVNDNLIEFETINSKYKLEKI